MYGLIFGAVAIVVRLVAHKLEFHLDQPSIIFLNLLLILLAIFFEGARQAKKSGYDFIDLFKAGMRGGILYAIVIAVFVYLFHTQIAPEILAERTAALIEGPGSGMTEENQESARSILTAGGYAQFSFFCYFLLSVFYSLLLAVVQRKVLSRL